MKPLIQKQKSRYLPLTLLIAGVLTGQARLVSPAEITNRATAGGDNLPTVTSNQTSATAGQPALEIIKTGDKAAAEPGDTIIYRLAIRNTGTTAATNLTVTDTLPLGLDFTSKSLRGSLTTGTTTTPVNLTTTTGSRRTVTINYSGSLAVQSTLNVVYAAVVTPDAIRGTGRNLATASTGNIQSNQASFQLRIQPGILSDCGTLVGRVFIDKNFDGEQRADEPGVPNAVIYMDDGNRIVTDANGLFSMPNVIAGNRTLTLDLSSLPGYSLAPNLYFIEKNSQSRLVRVEPSGMVRVNFAVTPNFREGKH